jgi:hypothetical protein
MKQAIILTAILVAGAVNTAAQATQTDQVSQAAIQTLEFLVGDWKGSGWIMGRDGERHPFDQTEKVQFKLDSTVILVEGLGKTGGIVTHNALAVISFDKAEQNFSFRSYLSTGLGGTFTGEVIEDSFYWYPNENMRYIIRINEDGQWFEKGEMNRGGEWFQFMEMILDRAG